MFMHVTPYAGDPILGLMDEFARDTRANKVNLGVGVYYDETGVMPTLECITAAEAQLVQEARPKGYLPMDGLPSYKTACQRLLFGNDYERHASRLATLATLGGSGALKVGADFWHAWFADAKVYVSDPTWANHIGIFEGAGIEVVSYPYYNQATGGLDLAGMLDALNRANKNDLVLLHPCCHNPTGVDLTTDQWDQVLSLIERKGLIAFMDMAYQGFGDDLDQDAYPVRRALDMGLIFLVSNSFSKNLGLYGERAGGLTVVCEDAKAAKRVLGQLKFTVRRIYSSPPLHATLLVDKVLNGELYATWVQEVASMRSRIQTMRKGLQTRLESQTGKDFGYLSAQRGMFSFTGLSRAQVERLKTEFGIYMVSNGRMCVAGLNSTNLDHVARGMARVLDA